MYKTLSFLNLLDNQKKISITNLAMYSILIKSVVSPFDWSAAISLFVVCLNYSHKRVVSSKAAQSSVDIQAKIEGSLADTKAQIEKMQSSVNGLLIKVGMKL